MELTPLRITSPDRTVSNAHSIVEFILVRHGQTDWNHELRLQGHSDIPLNAMGSKQAEDLAPTLADKNLEMILTSDLSRARNTAEIINRVLKVPIKISQALRETHMGVAEGMLRKEIIDMIGEDAWKQHHSIDHADLDAVLPGGETKRAALLRAKGFLEEAMLTYPNILRFCVVTHGGIIRRLVHSCEGAPSKPVPLPNCGIHVITFQGDMNKWSCLNG